MMSNAELMHDLRIPLQLMMSCAQLLEMEVGENKRAQNYVQMLMGNAMEMQRMLGSAMEQIRSENNAPKYVKSDIVHRTWDVYTRCQLYAGKKKIRLNFHANCDHLVLALDEEKFNRIMLNLVSNAIKFTSAGGRVNISLRALGDFAEVDVIDNGCGIEQERMDKIFDLHETSGGYGYGLYTARSFARQMGGDIRVVSKRGEGSVFTLRLPVRSIEAADLC